MNPIKVLADIMLQVLSFFYSISGNYGLAIVLLTVAVKVALYPLTLQSIEQMAAMSKLEPRLKEIQAKYKGKPDEIQKKTIELYQQAGVNPLGGCLPLLLQIPFFFALFFALTSKEFISLVGGAGARASFLWITNLAKPDPTYILAVTIGITTYYSQKTMPSPQSQQSQMMMYFMPIFIAFISVPFPAGVQLYWATQNILTIAQQLYIRRGI